MRGGGGVWAWAWIDQHAAFVITSVLLVKLKG
jgi:hypothetical protein